MKKQTNQAPESEYCKLTGLLGAYEKILHPDVFIPLLKQLHAAYEEAKEQAYRKAKISPEALEIEKIILDIKEKAEHNRLSQSFHMKYAYKQILQIFKTILDEQQRTV